MCRAVTIFLLTQRAMLGGPLRYLEHVRKANKKFLEAFEEKFQRKKTGFFRIFQPDFELHFILIFWVETFFSKASRNFFIGLTNIFKVSERSA